MLQIVWKQKHQSGHGTCDKKILTPPSIRICPLFGELKKGDYFYPPPSHMDQCLLLSNFFFLKASLNKHSPVVLKIVHSWDQGFNFHVKNFLLGLDIVLVFKVSC